MRKLDNLVLKFKLLKQRWRSGALEILRALIGVGAKGVNISILLNQLAQSLQCKV